MIIARRSVRRRGAAATLIAGALLAACSAEDDGLASAGSFCRLMAELDDDARVAYATLEDDVAHAGILRMRADFFVDHREDFEAIAAAAPTTVADDVSLLVSRMQARLDRAGLDHSLTPDELAAQERVVAYHRSSCRRGTSTDLR